MDEHTAPLFLLWIVQKGMSPDTLVVMRTTNQIYHEDLTLGDVFIYTPGEAVRMINEDTHALEAGLRRVSDVEDLIAMRREQGWTIWER